MHFHQQIRALLAQRNHLIEEVRSIHADAGDRDLNQTELDREERLATEIRGIDDRIGRANDNAESQKRAAEAAARTGTPPAKNDYDLRARDVDAPTEYAQAFLNPAETFLRSIESGHARAGVDIPLETRDSTLLASGTAGSGASTIPHNVHPQIWTHLVHESPLMMLGQTFPTSSGAPLSLSTSQSFSAPGIVEEGQQIAVDNPTFTPAEFTSYKIAAMGSVTAELEQDNAVGITAWALQQGTEALGRAAGVYLSVGTGTDEPQGIVNATAGHELATTTNVTLDDLIESQHKVNPSYRANSSWVLGDATLAEIRKLKDGDGNYLWRPATIAGQPDTLLGSPVYSDPSIPELGTAGSTVGVFGDFKRGFGIRLAGSIRVDTTRHFAFDHDLISLRFIMRMDARIIDDRALTAIATP